MIWLVFLLLTVSVSALNLPALVLAPVLKCPLPLLFRQPNVAMVYFLSFSLALTAGMPSQRRSSSRIQNVRSVIMPDLLYGSNAFSSSLKVSQLDRLQVLQNRAARAVYGLPPHTSAQPLLERMFLYRVRECYAQKRRVLVWRCFNGKASSVLQDLFSPSAGSTNLHQVSRGLTVPSAQSEAADLAWPFRQPWPGTLSHGV